MTDIFAGIIMIAIIGGIITYANPQFFPDMKEKVIEKARNIDILKNIPKVKSNDLTIIEVSSTDADNLISKCKKSFNDCKDIYHTKFGISVSISEIEEVNSLDEAWDFYDIWDVRIERYNKWQKEKINEIGFPQVLVAYSYHSPLADVKLPSIAVCNEEGELTQDSKGTLSCG